jgi:hypothetical protein
VIVVVGGVNWGLSESGGRGGDWGLTENGGGGGDWSLFCGVSVAQSLRQLL